MGCSFLVECGNVQISNSQQPISNLPRYHWIMDTGYWILDIYTFSHFPLPLRRASPFAKATEDKTEDKLIRANGFTGCSFLVECGNVQISNSQQPISNLPRYHWIMDTGYWILDIGYLHIFTFPSPCAERRRTISFAQMVFMGCSFLVECGNVQISNSQQPISNLPRHHWIMDTGYWILDNCTFSHFPLSLRRAAENKLICAKGFMGCSFLALASHISHC